MAYQEKPTFNTASHDAVNLPCHYDDRLYIRDGENFDGDKYADSLSYLPVTAAQIKALARWLSESDGLEELQLIVHEKSGALHINCGPGSLEFDTEGFELL